MVLGAKGVGDVMAGLNSKEIRLRNPAARTAVDLARTIQKDHPKDAEKLLTKVLKATEEQAVRVEAHMLLVKAGQQSDSSTCTEQNRERRIYNVG
jgi:hypothetical protein